MASQWICCVYHAQSLPSCPTLCNPMNCSSPGSSVHGFSRQEHWSGLPCPHPGESFRSRDRTHTSCTAGGFFTTEPLGKPYYLLCYAMLCYAMLSHFSHVRLCVTPQTAAHQAPPSLGFSRQEHWSGLPFPSPMHESEN